jgi:hypothetical protein
MHSRQITWNPQAGWTPVKAETEKVSLVFYFGTRQMLACGKRFSELREMFPAAHILGCSTGGQINNSDISDDEIVAAAISFDATRLQLVRQDISDAQQSRNCGETIGRTLQREDLAGIFVLSDGLNVNGSELVNGIVAAIGPNIPLTGGLAGDGADFVSMDNVSGGAELAVDLGAGIDQLLLTGSTANAGVTVSLNGGVGAHDALIELGDTFFAQTNLGFELGI